MNVHLSTVASPLPPSRLTASALTAVSRNVISQICTPWLLMWQKLLLLFISKVMPGLGAVEPQIIRFGSLILNLPDVLWIVPPTSKTIMLSTPSLSALAKHAAKLPVPLSLRFVT
jgi:hypothetical protein